MTAFHCACKNGLTKIVELMILKSVEFSININEKDENGWSGFHYACSEGHSAIVNLFIQNTSRSDLGLSLDSLSADKELKEVTPEKSKACVTICTKKLVTA